MNNRVMLLILLSVNSLFAGELLDKTKMFKSSLKGKPTEHDEILVIGLERVSHNVNPRPAYSVVFHRQGELTKVIFEGIEHIAQKGKYKCSISSQLFDRLVNVFLASDFFTLPDRFDPKTTDATEYVIYVKTRNGEKIVHDRNLPEFTNQTMWFLGEVIDGMLPKIEFLTQDGRPEAINVIMKLGQPTNPPYSSPAEGSKR
ncbi:MAG: DUF6438 domain-containing protein [Kiritimatiellae bacterium]|nr:DUF6438 domain-containing protein [Kiritimatiellia bacterium]MDD5521610.1 DUF6438 domain-containing protein [Kiritimatiellia bacterium]